MKYVILEKPDEMPRLVAGFAPLTHKQLAEPLVAQGFAAVSAGFVYFPEGKAYVVGASDSLSLESRPDDAKFIDAFNRAERRTAA